MLYNYTRGRFLENRRESDKVRKEKGGLRAPNALFVPETPSSGTEYADCRLYAADIFSLAQILDSQLNG